MMKKLLLLLTVAIAMLAFAAGRSCRQNEMDESQFTIFNKLHRINFGFP